MRERMRRTWLAALLVIVLVPLAPRIVRAQGPEPGADEPGEAVPSDAAPPVPDGEPPGGPPEEEPGPIEQIVRHVHRLIFPVETMQEATERLLLNILRRNIEGVQGLFSGLASDLTLQNPDLRGSSGPLWLGSNIFAPTWRFTVKLAVALWPATLAIMAAAAAKDALISTQWGVVELKTAMARWVGGVLGSALSLEILHQANRLSNAVIEGVITLPIEGATDLGMETLVNVLLGTALRVFGMAISPLAAVIAVGALLVLGLVMVISLIGQYFARVALLYVTVALAPIVLVIGILRPARWLQWLWIKGVLLVMLLGPVTTLLIKMAIAAHNAITHPILSFLMVVGVISVLLAISGAMIKGIFGAAAEVLGRAAATAEGVVQGGLAVGAAVLSGGAALGVLPSWAGALGGGVGAAGQVGGLEGAWSSLGAQRLGRGMSGEGARPAPPGPESSERQGAGPSGVEQGAPDAAAEARPAPGGGMGAPSAGYLGRVRRRWDRAGSPERAGAAGAAMEGAARVMGPRRLAGRTMGAVGGGLQRGSAQGAHAGEGRRGPTPSPGPALSTLSSDELRGYHEAVRDIRRDLRRPMEAAGLDLRQVERDAMAPVWAAAQHDMLANIARQAGFGDRESAQAMVSDFAASRIEGQLLVRGFLSERITRPGAPGSVPLSDHPALLDYERGQQMAWGAGGGDMTAYAGLHHAIRRYATTPQAGLEAATAFYGAAMEGQSVSGTIEAAREYGGGAGVPEERLEPWLQRLRGA